MVRAALDATDAGQLVRRAFVRPQVERMLRDAAAVDVLAVGKAAGPMLQACGEVSTVPFRHVVGIAPARPHALPPRTAWHTTAHPVPDERSITAGRAVLEMAAAARERDLLLVLLSGGASSLMGCPADTITLEHKRRTSQLLLEHGAEIHELNAVRKHLSAIKGGQLAAATSGSVLTLAVSDVVGDDLSAIGSGPTVPDPTTFDEALDVLDRHGGRDQYPAAVRARLERGAAGHLPETPKAGDGRLSRSYADVIGGGRTAIAGARGAAESLGYAVHVLDEPVTGEARIAGCSLVDAAQSVVRARMLAAGAPPLCILAAGETTVRVTGTGKGGRNQECALAMARGLDRLGSVVVAASIGTDGVDGPTDAAGGIVDTTTLSRAEAADAGPIEGYLANNNSYVFLNALGDLIRTGPTSTNVGDLQVILVGGW